MVWAFENLIKKDPQCTFLIEKKSVEQSEWEIQDVSLEIAATADFDVWSPVHPHVSIELEETREVSKKSTEVDNEQLQT